MAGPRVRVRIRIRVRVRVSLATGGVAKRNYRGGGDRRFNGRSRQGVTCEASEPLPVGKKTE
eukprot:1353749-Amorphochlora_amoeboformis.AAC.1